MEAAIIGVIGRIAPLLFGFLNKKYELIQGLEEDIRSIRNEFKMISAAIEEAGNHPLRSDGKVHMRWIEIVRDLARDIEDCVEHFTHLVSRKMIKPIPWLDFAEEIKKLKGRSVAARHQREAYSTKKRLTGGSSSLDLEPGEPEAYTAAPVGMEAAWRELKQLISETPQDQSKKLKVISIVGFAGIGKSQLADYAYNKIEQSEYPEKAWVHAAGRGAEDVLKEMHRQLRSNSEGDFYSLRKLRASLREYLHNKRFFIVIDGLQTSSWDGIKDAFPVASGVSSRVIVTTATHSVATKCSSCDGHVYVMRTLDGKHSRKLFFQTASLDFQPQPDDTELGSQVIEKCDGLPLALITTAGVLSGYPTEEQWADLGKNLAEYMEDKDELVNMQRVLDRSYTRLGSQEIKTCLLYLGIYPCGHPIRTGKVMRKWLAEGLIKDSTLEVAIRNLNELVNQSIIQPITDVSSSNNSAVLKECQTHGMILEFILRKSMCQEFITLIYCKDMPNLRHSKSKSKVRWLSVQHNARCKIDEKDLPMVRSLTIFGEAHNSLLAFSKYKLMKVLDLEECRVIMGDSHLKDICSNLVLLRYLSLGAAVKVRALPTEIEMLTSLETLDVRRTKIEIVPTEVMELPCLVHLFGKLKLQGNGIVDRAKGKIQPWLPGNSKSETDNNIGDQKLKQLQDWLSENSKLETLAGFVVDKSQEMPQLIKHMKNLTKVKIWCESTPNSDKIKHFRKAIKGFIERGTSRDNAPSLSLNFNTEWHQDLLYLPLKKDRPYHLNSLKLQGTKIFSTLPSFLTLLGGLRKLCLSFPGHKLSSEFLAALIKVPHLEYLKLVATELGNLVIPEGVTLNLRRLCVVVEVMTGLEVKEGALQRLDSLWLLCKDLNGFSGTTIQSLPLLKEVALHNGLSPQTKKDWKKEAKDHRRRPKVLFAETERMTSEPAVKITFVAPATDATADSVAMPASATPTEKSVLDVTSEIASVSMKMTHYAIANAETDNHGYGEHDDREKTCIDSSDDSKEFATGNSSSTSTEISEGEMAGKDQRMEDDTHVPARKQDDTRGCRIIDQVSDEITEMMNMVREDGAPYDSDVFYYASVLFMEMQYRAVFKSLKTETAEVRLGWIQKTWERIEGKRKPESNL